MDLFTRFVRELQQLEQPTKQRVLVVSALVLMAVVVYFWAGYFGGLITPIAQPGRVAQAAPQTLVPQTADAQASQPGFWQNMKTGAAALYNMMRGPKQYDIQPQQ